MEFIPDSPYALRNYRTSTLSFWTNRCWSLTRAITQDGVTFPNFRDREKSTTIGSEPAHPGSVNHIRPLSHKLGFSNYFFHGLYILLILAHY